MNTHWFAVWLNAACASGSPHGASPEAARPAPVFDAVLNHEGEQRDRSDLVGQPTVLWFYPAANTPG